MAENIKYCFATEVSSCALVNLHLEQGDTRYEVHRHSVGNQVSVGNKCFSSPCCGERDLSSLDQIKNLRKAITDILVLEVKADPKDFSQSEILRVLTPDEFEGEVYRALEEKFISPRI
jgi:hypothetical protein